MYTNMFMRSGRTMGSGRMMGSGCVYTADLLGDSLAALLVQRSHGPSVATTGMNKFKQDKFKRE